MSPLTAAEIQAAFDQKHLTYLESPEELLSQIRAANSGKDVILLMSSGNFNGMDIQKLNP